jgi:Mg-chelatase subunit ChlD
VAKKKSQLKKVDDKDSSLTSADLLPLSRMTSLSPQLSIAVEELLLSLPPETRDHVHFSSEEDFIDFCETHSVSRSIELKSREIKKQLLKEIFREIKNVSKIISNNKIISVKTEKPIATSLDLDSTLLSYNLKLNEWFNHKTIEKQERLNFYIDNSSSISFSKRLELAKNLALVLMSYKKAPQLKIYFFSESIKELDWKKGDWEDFLKQYLSIKSQGFTDIAKALRHLESKQISSGKTKTIFISDGVSSIGQKRINIKLPQGKVHYLKLSGKKSQTSEDLERIIEQNKGKTVIINSKMSMLKPLYQIIKRL